MKKVQSSRYFGANIQWLTCNKDVFALYTHRITIISKPLNKKEPGPRTREDIPSRTLENWFDEVAEADDPGTRPPRRPEACNLFVLYMGKARGDEGVGHNGKMLIMEENLAWETA